jgi:hypothetical protein
MEAAALDTDTVEIKCNPSQQVRNWTFMVRNTGKAAWPDTTVLALE